MTYLRPLLFLCLFFSPKIGFGQSLAELQARFDSLFQQPGRLAELAEAGQKLTLEFEKTGIRDSAKYGGVALNTGIALSKLGQYEAGFAFAKTAYAFCKPNSENQLVAQQWIASWRLVNADYATGDSLLRDAQQRHRKYLNTSSKAFFTVLSTLAGSQFAQGRYDASAEILQNGIALLEQQNMAETQIASRFYSSLANTKQFTGQLGEAEKLHLLSLEILKKRPPGSPPAYTQSLEYAQLLEMQGKPGEALETIEKLEREMLAANWAHSLHFAEMLIEKGVVQENLGLTNEATATYRESLRLLNEFDHTREYTYFQVNYLLAQMLMNLGKTQDALHIGRVCRDSMLAFQLDTSVQFCNLLAGIGQCEMALGEFTAAIADFRKALQISDLLFSDRQNTHFHYLSNCLSEASLAAGNFQEAISTLQPYFQNNNSPQFRPTLGIMARTQAAKGDLPAAFDLFGRLTEKDKTRCGDILFILTEAQRLGLNSDLLETADELLSFLAAHPAANSSALALDFQLFKKSLLLSAAQKIRQNIQADPALAPVFADFTDTRERLAWAYTQAKADLEQQKISLPALESRADSLEKIIARSRSDFASASLREPFSWRDVRAKLRHGEAALEIARFREYRIEQTDTVRYAIFIITSGNENVGRVSNPSDVAPAVIFIKNGDHLEQILTEKYLAECATPGGKGNTQELFETIWQPLEPYLKNVNRVFVSADGAFQIFNLGALRRPNGHFLAENMDIRPVFSLRDIENVGRVLNPSDVRKTAFLAGNPTFSTRNETETGVASRSRSLVETDSFPPVSATDPMPILLRDFSETRGLRLEPLPGSQLEVEEISKLLAKNGWQTTSLTGDEATETAVKSARNPAILHLATHGYFLANERSGTAGLSRGLVERNPMLRSMLFFAGAQKTLDRKSNSKNDGDDGVLTAFEAQNLNLENTELVVLSACQTAQGKVQNGEGVYGLQRALRIAGAQTILLSLWDVDDVVGREFMLVFYEKWLGGMGKAEAFRAAQLAVKARWPEPFYWAGFVLVGG